ncbi:MAG: transketolase, partial [Candidatus Methylacidiphilales bacterium]
LKEQTALLNELSEDDSIPKYATHLIYLSKADKTYEIEEKIIKSIIENQGAYQYLDYKPITISAKAHRPPYGTDGDYWSKPNAEEIFEVVCNMMSDYEPGYFPKFL